MLEFPAFRFNTALLMVIALESESSILPSNTTFFASAMILTVASLFAKIAPPPVQVFTLFTLLFVKDESMMVDTSPLTKIAPPPVVCCSILFWPVAIFESKTEFFIKSVPEV